MSKRFLSALDLTGTISTVSAAERSIKWNDGEGTLELGLKGGNVKLPVGQEEISLCYNGTGSTLNKGTVVYISGAQGQRPSITKASASSESTSSKTFGVVSENISNGSEGFVTTFGVVPNINTSSFTEGAALWLSTTAGEITQTPPTAPNHAVFVGYCLKSNISSGRIFVKVQNGYELQELHNVSITNPTTGQILQYNSVTGVWENVNSSSTPDVFYQTTAPSSPNVGNIWIDSDESVLTYDSVTLNDLIPNQTGNSGKYLTTDGSSISWAVVDSFPSQTNNSGKYLTTNGSAVSWGSIDLSAYATITSLSNHESDTTNIHGITNTADLVLTNDARLSDSRTPTTHASSHGSAGSDAITIAQSQVTNLTTDLSAKANLASPTFTGTPSAPTAAAATNTTQIATTAYVRTEISNLVASAPAALDTLNELATALGNDANFSTTVNTALSNRVLTTGGSTITVASGTTVPLTIQNNGTGNSFVVNDEASDATPFIIDASGNVGIGQSSPQNLLDVSGIISSRNTNEWNIRSVSTNTTSTNRNHFIAQRANGSSAVTSGFNLGGLTMAGFDGTNYSFGWNGGAEINAYATQTWTPTARGTSISIWNTPNGSTTITERLKIDQDGRIFIPNGGVLEAPVSTNAQTGTGYTLVLADAGKLVEMSSGSAATVTVPADGTTNFPIGTKIDILRTGGGEISIAGATSPSTVTVNSEGSKLRINAQWQAVTLIKRAANTWVLIGALKA